MVCSCSIAIEYVLDIPGRKICSQHTSDTRCPVLQYGWTPLHAAADQGNVEVCKAILDYGDSKGIECFFVPTEVLKNIVQNYRVAMGVLSILWIVWGLSYTAHSCTIYMMVHFISLVIHRPECCSFTNCLMLKIQYCVGADGGVLGSSLIGIPWWITFVQVDVGMLTSVEIKAC